MKSVKTERCVCVLRDLAPQIKALVARMKNTSVSLHFCLIIKFQLFQIWQIQIWFLLFTHTFAKWSLFTSLRSTHLFSSLGNQFWIRLEADHHLYWWKRHLWPLSKHREWRSNSRFYPWSSRTVSHFCPVSLQLLFSVENYVRHIRDSLDYLHKEVKSHLLCSMSSLIVHLPALVKCSCLCPGASSSGELSRASRCHSSQGITHGPFPQMSNGAVKVREFSFSINNYTRGDANTNNNIWFC